MLSHNNRMQSYLFSLGNGLQQINVDTHRRHTPRMHRLAPPTDEKMNRQPNLHVSEKLPFIY